MTYEKAKATERDIQNGIINVATKLGCGVMRINATNRRTVTDYVHSYITYPSHLTRGCADIIIFHNGKCIMIECKKDRTTKQLPEQQTFQKWCEWHGTHYFVCGAVSVAEIIMRRIFKITYPI